MLRTFTRAVPGTGGCKRRFKKTRLTIARILNKMKELNYPGYVGIEYVWTVWEHCNEVDNLSETIQMRDHLRNLQREANSHANKRTSRHCNGSRARLGRRHREDVCGSGRTRACCAILRRRWLRASRKRLRRKGGQALALTNDISKPAETEKLVESALDKFGRVDILVNNAGICPRISIDDMTEEMYDRIMNVNLKAVFFLIARGGQRDEGEPLGTHCERELDGRAHRRHF